MDRENGEKVKIVYMGKRINDNKICHLYGHYESLERSFFVRGKLGEYGVGAIIEVFDHGNYFKPPYICIGKINDVVKIASWEIEHILSGQQKQSQQHWKKLENSEYERLVSKINNIVSSLPSSQRKAFLFRLIADIDFKG
ncbi:MAG: hypothetical protein ACTH64_08565 [Providencia sp.]|uniref:hypothetical protein n=1 Tax=Psychrobacter sp. TaxID=56811 RepID=UPI002649EBF8|nr:hypothetical protein [Psychrobacter sp.]MDN5619697.1 hypothetical protein [Psychrobacter sp.]